MSVRSAARVWTQVSMLLALALTPLAQPAAQQRGDREFTPRAAQPGKDVPWMPTPPRLVETMLRMARITPQDYVIDLGSGDGRIAIAAAKKFGARSLGVEYNPDLVALSRREAQRQGVADRARFVEADMFETDLSSATIIAVYLLPAINEKLQPRILDQKPGTRVVSHQFGMGAWQPDESATVDNRAVHLWIVPARVGGTWALRVENGAQERRLSLIQEYQALTGRLSGARATLQLSNAGLRGDRIRFSVIEGAVQRHFRARVRGRGMDGIVRAAGSPDMRWSATRR